MERKFYPENFEKFLKGYTDEFKMSPSKKVWQGIYNDLHPGRRWPSVAMSLLFIFTLVIIGHLNINNGHDNSLYDLNSSNTADIKSVKAPETIKPSEANRLANSGNIADNNNGDPANGSNQLSQIKDIKLSQINIPLPAVNESKLNNAVTEIKAENPAADKIENNPIKNFISDPATTPSQNLSLIKKEEYSNIPTSNIIKEDAFDKEINLNTEWQPNTANIQKPKKVNNLTLSYYVAPSVSYRHLSDDKINNAVTHKPVLGYEAGTAMSFNIYKKLQFTTGLQVNYSGYKTHANNTHPISATLILNNATGANSVYSAISQFGNNAGTEIAKLKNYSLQASLPIGLQYSFAGNEKIKFDAAAAFQPSFIIASQGYLLSTDKRNYITNPDLFRKWNMNTNLSAFASFTSNSINWQIGPQIRYQILSTYSDRYPVKERLFNYGIRIGISKGSK